MPKGGARVNSGPPPDPTALRRERPTDRDGWTSLPAAGFAGDIPAWPLVPTHLAEPDRELAVWERIWRTPQADAWSRMGWEHDVAVYVRCLVIGELGVKDMLAEARQWSDRLGLNPAAMLRNRWRVESVTAPSGGIRRPSPRVGRPSARERLKALDGGAA